MKISKKKRHTQFLFHQRFSFRVGLDLPKPALSGRLRLHYRGIYPCFKRLIFAHHRTNPGVLILDTAHGESGRTLEAGREA